MAHTLNSFDYLPLKPFPSEAPQRDSETNGIHVRDEGGGRGPEGRVHISYAFNRVCLPCKFLMNTRARTHALVEINIYRLCGA